MVGEVDRESEKEEEREEEGEGEGGGEGGGEGEGGGALMEGSKQVTSEERTAGVPVEGSRSIMRFLYHLCRPHFMITVSVLP